jgi:hypothetical protein
MRGVDGTTSERENRQVDSATSGRRRVGTGRTTGRHAHGDRLGGVDE